MEHNITVKNGAKEVRGKYAIYRTYEQDDTASAVCSCGEYEEVGKRADVLKHAKAHKDGS